ncbi:MAG: ClpP-like prohead protease/major capsid protein fusion protein [Gallionellaceae bacterium]
MPQANQAKWYSIRASKRGEVKAAEILIYGDIGESWDGETVAAKDFVKELAALDAAQITVRINSVGGSVHDGIAIYNAIKRHPASITVIIDSVAYSVASLIAMAGDTVEMAENALLMIHAPWTYTAGNSAEMRELADVLDTYAQAMSTSYAAKTGRPQAEMLALLTDGADHYYTAAEALEEKFIDTIVQAMPLAASSDREAMIARFKKTSPATAGEQPAAAAATTSKETVMPGANQPAAPVQAAAKTDAEIQATGVQIEAKRRTDISASFAAFKGRDGVEELLASCQADVNCSAEKADKKLLDMLGKKVEPVAGSSDIQMGESGRDRFIADAVESILSRGAARDEKGQYIKARANNPLKGAKLADMARMCLAHAGIKLDTFDQMRMVGAAFNPRASGFSQSISDFPVLLEAVMHKSLQAAYAVAPDTWSRFCSIGSVSDFRAHNRYRVGSIGNLDALAENGEFKNKSIPDGEKSSITAGTKGNIINISRQIIVNDDLQSLVTLTAMLGRAYKRTIEADVYALLAENAGLGPTLDSDSKTLFHADHGNLVATGSGAAPTVTTLDAARMAMALQTDISGNDYLDLRPAIWLGPLALGTTVRVANSATYDPDTSNKLQKPNGVLNLFRDVIDSPRTVDSYAWYEFADPNEAPVVEVAFLDGVQEPYMELQNGFDVDGAQYKVRGDHGVAGIDYRGAQLNQGH